MHAYHILVFDKTDYMSHKTLKNVRKVRKEGLSFSTAIVYNFIYKFNINFLSRITTAFHKLKSITY